MTHTPNVPAGTAEHASPDHGSKTWQAEMAIESGTINDALREGHRAQDAPVPVPPVDVIDSSRTGSERAVEANEFRQRPS